jgi:hypothetical protein
MKNEKKTASEGFKKQLDDLSSPLSTALRGVKSDEDFAYVILHMKEMMPSLTNDMAKGGLKLASQTLSSSPAVSMDSPNAMYDKMPMPKNEAFARMVKLANLKD